MRKPEFRAWDIDAKKMRYHIMRVGWSLHGITSCHYLDEELSEIPLYNLEGTVGERDHFILMESTGLNDKSGSLVWEGDIVYASLNENTYVVEYGDYDGEHDVEEWEHEHHGPHLKDKFGSREGIGNADRCIKVIGDIYTTPELLDKNK